MELNITEFFNTATPRLYSGSKMEYGEDCAAITRGNAVLSSMDYQILDDDDKRDAFRQHVKGFGAWTDEEIAAWNPQELNALLIQMISGDIRESCLNENPNDWEAYWGESQNGNNSGRLSKGDDGNIYYYIGD